MFEALGREAGCQRLSAAFYARVGKDPILRPLFPGKSLRCATEEFAAFLIQFLGGAEEHTQRRWWLSLRESHARFRIGASQRRSWLKHMAAALEAAQIHETTRDALLQFFELSSAYITGEESGKPEHEELAACWSAQQTVEEAIAAIVAGRDANAIALAENCRSRPSVFAGLLARMVASGQAELIQFVVRAVTRDPSSGARRWAGRTLLHYASAAGCLEVVALLLRFGADPTEQTSTGHPPLYCVANECASEAGPEIVNALVRAGADVNAHSGVTRATALHMAARRGHVSTARALLDFGAAIGARDSKGDTPLQRAINCRKNDVARLLMRRGGSKLS